MFCSLEIKTLVCSAGSLDFILFYFTDSKTHLACSEFFWATELNLKPRFSSEGSSLEKDQKRDCCVRQIRVNLQPSMAPNIETHSQSQKGKIKSFSSLSFENETGWLFIEEMLNLEDKNRTACCSLKKLIKMWPGNDYLLRGVP